MTATRQDIESWYDEAVRRGATHLIVGLDTFDHDNFPIYIMPGESCEDRVRDLGRSGNSYDEVYDLSLDRGFQMREHRAIHIPNDSKRRR